MTRLPPHNSEAERCLLGSVLRDSTILGDVARLIRPEDLYFAAHQTIYRACLDLHAQAKPIDAALIADHLGDRVDDLGEYRTLAVLLSELWESATTSANAMHYAGIVRDHATRRRLIHVCQDIATDACDGAPADELLARAQQAVLEAGGDCLARVHAMRDMMGRAADRIDLRLTGQADDGLTTGLDRLDRLIGLLTDAQPT